MFCRYARPELARHEFRELTTGASALILGYESGLPEKKIVFLFVLLHRIKYLRNLAAQLDEVLSANRAGPPENIDQQRITLP